MNNKNKLARFGINFISGAIPFAGGIFSAIAGVWGEHEQEKVNDFLLCQMQMMQDEWKEKEKTLVEITQRLDFQDDKITQRIQSPEYQSLFKKAFRDWGAVESEEKRVYIRNILANSATTGESITGDDVVRMFLEWIKKYSDSHFKIIKLFYHNPNSTRYDIWSKLNKTVPREDSADADLFKLIITDLSLGHIIRQYRERDPNGNFYKTTGKPRGSVYNNKTMTSAFEDNKSYELTALGVQFIHYATQDVTIKLEYKKS